MNFTLNQLRIFLKLSETQHITKTAEALFLTQPAVSIQLKKLQDQFDIPLTETIGKKIFLTNFGKEIAGAADKILAEVFAIHYKTLAYKGFLTGSLTISVVSTGKYVMPYFLSPFIQKNPGIDLKMDVTNKEKVVQNLERNEVDFSLVSVMPPALALEKITLLSNKLFLIGPAGDVLPKKKNTKDILSQMPLIFREKGSGTRQTLEQYLQQHHIPVSPKLELTSNEAVKQAVLAGLGYAVMPLVGIRNEIEQGQLRIIPVKGFPLLSAWHLVWLNQKKFLPVAQAFLDFIKESHQQTGLAYFGWLDAY